MSAIFGGASTLEKMDFIADGAVFALTENRTLERQIAELKKENEHLKAQLQSIHEFNSRRLRTSDGSP